MPRDSTDLCSDCSWRPPGSGPLLEVLEQAEEMLGDVPRQWRCEDHPLGESPGEVASPWGSESKRRHEGGRRARPEQVGPVQEKAARCQDQPYREQGWKGPRGLARRQAGARTQREAGSVERGGSEEAADGKGT